MTARGDSQSYKAPISRGALALILSALAVGVGVAIHLIWIKLRLEFDPTYVSSCNFSEKLNCDAVQTSEYATVLGFPLALYGAGTYLFYGLLAVLGRRSERAGPSFHALLAFASLAGCLHSLYLAYISSVVIGAYCLFCMAMYAVNLLVAGIAAFFVFRDRGLKGAFRDLGDLRSLAVAGALYALILGISLPAFSQVRATLKDERIAEVRKELSQRRAPPDTTVDEAKRKHPEAKKGAPPATKPKGVNAQLKRQGDLVYSDVITRKGRSYLKIPVREDDFALGPADAPVTVVEFADFECGYCRMLTRNLKPLKKKYEGKVRWVFKHFPLNNSCNKVMKGTQHPRACAAARAANCAGLQGFFWKMHDQLFANAHKLKDEDLRSHAEAVGADLEKWDLCMKDPGVDRKITSDTMIGRFARISGTPRMYINGHLVPGVHATEVLDYYIQAALDEPEVEPPAEDADTGRAAMIKANTTAGDFYMDAHEASMDTRGAAISRAGVLPAQASWFEGKEACEKAGKRLCSEEEWISACSGSPAVDNDGDKLFSDDAIEGRMFPYGFFHEGGRCHDNEPKQGGSARPTGSFPDCRTPSGIFDLSGNLAEWTGTTEAEAAVTGSYFNGGQKASCVGRQTRFGPGYRNHTTGFRCCSDKEVQPQEAEAVEHANFARVGAPFPAIRVNRGDDTFITEADLKGAVHLVAFFASWCGPCRKELPAFNDFYLENKNRDLKVLAIGVDLDQEKAMAFVEGLKLDYSVGFDPQAVSMGACSVKGMPTALLVDAQGIIRARLEGINKAKTDAFLDKARALLKP